MECDHLETDPSTTGFLSLANELILDIADLLGTQGDTSRLAQVNQRLQLLFTDQLLSFNIQQENSDALKWAASKNHQKMAGRMIRLGADLNPKVWGPPLHEAAGSGHFDMVQLLLDEGADPEAKNRSNDTAITVALKANNEAMACMLFDKLRTIRGASNALLEASRLKESNFIRYVLEAGVPADSKNPSNSSALDLVVWRDLAPGHDLFKNRFDDDAFKSVTILLEYGADPDRKGRNASILQTVRDNSARHSDPRVRVLLAIAGREELVTKIDTGVLSQGWKRSTGRELDIPRDVLEVILSTPPSRALPRASLKALFPPFVDEACWQGIEEERRAARREAKREARLATERQLNAVIRAFSRYQQSRTGPWSDLVQDLDAGLGEFRRHSRGGPGS
ncbi:ankyrin [Lophium mytilinum]|uniref:Ankyrin n=1 Tax=Lophium mytilinum TaxID=390894 RepID=A0A6A6QZK3_9PEZI|nr:ankyrin [Lophium mytilinum]